MLEGNEASLIRIFCFGNLLSPTMNWKIYDPGAGRAACVGRTNRKFLGSSSRWDEKLYGIEFCGDSRKSRRLRNLRRRRIFPSRHRFMRSDSELTDPHQKYLIANGQRGRKAVGCNLRKLCTEGVAMTSQPYATPTRLWWLQCTNLRQTKPINNKQHAR